MISTRELLINTLKDGSDGDEFVLIYSSEKLGKLSEPVETPLIRMYSTAGIEKGQELVKKAHFDHD